MWLSSETGRWKDFLKIVIGHGPTFFAKSVWCNMACHVKNARSCANVIGKLLSDNDMS